MASSVRNGSNRTMSRVRDFPVPHPGQFSLPLWVRTAGTLVMRFRGRDPDSRVLNSAFLRFGTLSISPK